MNRQPMTFTGTSAPTYWFGCDPCPHCGSGHRYTAEFHGYFATYCGGCGESA